MEILYKFNERVARDLSGKVIYLFGITQLILLSVSYSLNEWIDGTTNYENVENLEKGSCGDDCNVQIGLWGLQKETAKNRTFEEKLRSCPENPDFHLRLFLSQLESVQDPRPRICEDCPDSDSIAHPCILLMIPMNSIKASWSIFGIAIGTSFLSLLLPWVKFAGYRIRWILVGYMSVFTFILQIMGTLTIVSAFENIVYSDTFEYRSQEG